MASRKDVDIEKEKIRGKKLSRSDLNKLSTSTGLKILDQYPDTYKNHIKTNPICKAIKELLNEMKNE